MPDGAAVTGTLHGSQGQAMGITLQDESPVFSVKDRIFMTGTGRYQAAGGDRQDAQPDGYEHIIFVSFTQAVVDIMQDIRGIPVETGKRHIFDQSLGNDHEQGGRNALARYIRHDQGKMVFVNQIEIIEVSADFLGRIHDCVQIKFPAVREGRELCREHVQLNFRGNGQFRIQTLFFRGDFDDLVHIAPHFFRHIGEGPGQDLDLITGQQNIVHLKAHIISLHLRYPQGHPLDGTDQAFGKEQGQESREKQHKNR